MLSSDIVTEEPRHSHNLVSRRIAFIMAFVLKNINKHGSEMNRDKKLTNAI